MQSIQIYEVQSHDCHVKLSLQTVSVKDIHTYIHNYIQYNLILPHLQKKSPAMHYTAGWVSYGQKCKTGTGRQYFADIIGSLQPL